MITSIKNAIATKKETVVVPFSNYKTNILEILKKYKYIKDFKVNSLSNNKKNIKIFLNYERDKPVINHIKVISTPGLRYYCKYYQIPRVLGGIGDVIISTPKGVMMGKSAKKQKVGGELVCEVY